MLVEVKDWQDELKPGDLIYYKRSLLKVTRLYTGKDGRVRTVKFRKIGRVKLTPYSGVIRREEI